MTIRFDAFHLPDMDDAVLGGWTEVDIEGVTFRHPRLSPAAIERSAGRLREARRAALRDRPVGDVVTAIDRATALLEDDAELRAAIAVALPAASGLSSPGARRVLERMRADWCRDSLERVLRFEFGGEEPLDRFVPETDPHEARAAGPRRHVRALGPALTSHLLAGNVPGVGVTAIVRCLLVKSAVFAKMSAGDSVLPTAFARALARVDPGLGRCLALACWPGGELEHEPLNTTLVRAGDCVVVYGGEDAVRFARAHAATHARVVIHGPKVACALLGRAALDSSRLDDTAERAALAVGLFDQQGCVSPHLLYVETGGEHTPLQFAHALAAAFERLETRMPRGRIGAGEAAAIREIRTVAELREARDPAANALLGPPDLAFSVIYDEDPRFEPSCLNRTVRVKPVDRLSDVCALLAPVAGLLQSIGMAGVERTQQLRLAEALAGLGATRITDLDRLPWPDPAFHHDGVGPLRELVRFVDVETVGGR